MKRSTDHILTTHTGSLPRPRQLVEALTHRDRGDITDEESHALGERVAEAVRAVVAEQVAVGLDVVNDGEMGKIGYSTYVKERLTGFEGEGQMAWPADLMDYPSYAERLGTDLGITTPSCTGEIAYRGAAAVEEDISNLMAAAEGQRFEASFLSAASPGVISLFLPIAHYASYEDYVFALADAMRQEYQAIADSGILLQLDCPDLAMGRHIQFADASLEDFRRNAHLHVEALNHAVSAIPAEQLRMHLCWGNYEGPHHRDVPLAEILDVAFSAKPQVILFEAANPRHEHEWKAFESRAVPEGKVLVPGVIDSTTNYIEHPELVAERIVRFADVAGKENVMAGTDCGFATFAAYTSVVPEIVRAKMGSLVEGAEMASSRLW